MSFKLFIAQTHEPTIISPQDGNSQIINRLGNSNGMSSIIIIWEETELIYSLCIKAAPSQVKDVGRYRVVLKKIP